MSDINIKNFVDINIQRHITSSATGTRDTVVLFTPDGTASTTRLIESYKDAVTYYEDDANTLAYLKVFFDNGGVKCLVIEGVAYTALTKTLIDELENKYVLVAAVVATADVELGYAKMKALAIARETEYGIDEKLLLTRSYVYTDEDLVKDLVVKYSNVLGAEMSIAAYLTRIDVYKQNTVFDYMFTSEILTDTTPYGAETLTDDTYQTIIERNYNVDIRLAGKTLNMGGDCKNGEDITNTFVNIVLHQTLTDRLLDLLVSKIKNNTGLAQIYTTIAQELEYYRTSGYLTTDKMWTKDDLNIVYNGVTYGIIKKGTALPSGYLVRILPLSSLTEQDKLDRKTPPIYVIIADQFGIRAITVNGEVI